MSHCLRNLAPALILAFATGCPPLDEFPVAIPGEWAFTFYDLNGVQSIPEPAFIILADGGAANTEPPGRSLTFTGVATWGQDSGTFTMLHIKGAANETLYNGTIYAPTDMEGILQQTVGGSAVGLWSAVRQ